MARPLRRLRGRPPCITHQGVCQRGGTHSPQSPSLDTNTHIRHLYCCHGDCGAGLPPPLLLLLLLLPPPPPMLAPLHSAPPLACVSTSAPLGVMASVCSNCAERLPSAVTTVHPSSSQVRVWRLRRQHKGGKGQNSVLCIPCMRLWMQPPLRHHPARYARVSCHCYYVTYVIYPAHLPSVRIGSTVKVWCSCMAPGRMLRWCSTCMQRMCGGAWHDCRRASSGQQRRPHDTPRDIRPQAKPNQSQQGGVTLQGLAAVAPPFSGV